MRKESPSGLDAQGKDWLLVTGIYFEKGKQKSYAYMASRATIWDHELIAWPNRREKRG